MSNFAISYNAFHIGQINELRALVARCMRMDFSKLTYVELRDEVKINCQLLSCNYIVDGQKTQGYKNLMTCEDSELLTDIAHGLNRFVHSNFKFSACRKIDLCEIFNDYWKKLDDLCNATLRELDRKTPALRFSLPNIHGMTTNRVSMVNQDSELINASNMSYFYADIKNAIAADKLAIAKQALDFETVITENNYFKLADRDGVLDFALPADQLLRVSIRNSRQAKYFVSFALKDKEGSKLASLRETLKRDANLFYSMSEIVINLRNFAGLCR